MCIPAKLAPNGFFIIMTTGVLTTVELVPVKEDERELLLLVAAAIKLAGSQFPELLIGFGGGAA